jgi:hypothetical protein
MGLGALLYFSRKNIEGIATSCVMTMAAETTEPSQVKPNSCCNPYAFCSVTLPKIDELLI